MLTSCAMTRLSQTTMSSSITGRGCRRTKAADVLDHAAGGGRRARGLHLDVGLHQRRDVGARDERERQHRHDGRGDEGEEQLAVEAGAHLAQQRAARGRRPRRDQPLKNSPPSTAITKTTASAPTSSAIAMRWPKASALRRAEHVDGAAVVQDVGVSDSVPA